MLETNPTTRQAPVSTHRQDDGRRSNTRTKQQRRPSDGSWQHGQHLSGVRAPRGQRRGTDAGPRVPSPPTPAALTAPNDSWLIAALVRRVNEWTRRQRRRLARWQRAHNRAVCRRPARRVTPTPLGQSERGACVSGLRLRASSARIKTRHLDCSGPNHTLHCMCYRSIVRRRDSGDLLRVYIGSVRCQ